MQLLDDESFGLRSDGAIPMLKRVTCCAGWAIHGLIFEFIDGSRHGILLFNDGSPYYPTAPVRPNPKPRGDSFTCDDLRDTHLSTRGNKGWHAVELGDYIVSVDGFRLDDSAPDYLFYSIRLKFASGDEASWQAEHAEWKGPPFQLKIEPDMLVRGLSIARHTYRRHFKNLRLIVKRSTLSLHWTIPKRYSDFELLHPMAQLGIRTILLLAVRLNSTSTSLGLTNDLWHRILGFLAGFQLFDLQTYLRKRTRYSLFTGISMPIPQFRPSRVQAASQITFERLQQINQTLHTDASTPANSSTFFQKTKKTLLSSLGK